MPRKPPTYKPPGTMTRPERDKDYQQRHGDDAARKLRSSGRYKKFRRWAIRRHPICADPFGFHRQDSNAVAAQDLHHVVSVAAAPDLVCSLENVVGLCRPCHNRVSALERAGQDTAGLFGG